MVDRGRDVVVCMIVCDFQSCDQVDANNNWRQIIVPCLCTTVAVRRTAVGLDPTLHNQYFAHKIRETGLKAVKPFTKRAATEIERSLVCK